MNKGRSSYMIIAVISIFLGMMVILSFAEGFAPDARAQGPAATPTPTTPAPAVAPGLLDRPIVSDPPTQVEKGSLIFWGVCMACHGDHGQGLTDEWRQLAFKEDMNCWVSKCHASNHPPQGFEFPKIVPALVGGGRLGRFSSAQQLYDYLVAAMPWWNPGSLSSEQAWQITAYLLKLNGTLPAGVLLDGRVASAIPVHRKLSLPQDDATLALIFAAVLSLATLGIVLREALPRTASIVVENPGQRQARPLRRPSFVSHLHPPTIPAAQARWRYTLGAGGIAVFFCLVLVVTGLLEMFYYVPTPAQAPVSIETIHYFVPFGALVRNLHYWSAQLLVIVALIHLLRVVFTGAYAARRRFNFLLGMGMFVFVLLLDFTGYVLRWDEGIRWALTAGTNLLSSIPTIGPAFFQLVVGASQVGPSTLVRFYAWHIFTLSTGAAIILIWHLFRVRRDGGISAPAASPARSTASPSITPRRITRSELVRRELLGMLIAGIVLILISTFVPAPLAAPIQGNPSLSTDTRAPWFFLWVQQLLKLGDPFLLGVLVPVVILLAVAAIPYALPGPRGDELGRWFPTRGRIAQILVAVFAIAILALTLLAILPASNV